MRRLFKLSFPRQFWLMFVGMLISPIGSSMIWPFLMIYVSERLGMPLTYTAMLLTLNSVMGLISSFIAGPIIDRLGRKWVMVISLLLNGVGFLLMSQAHTLLAFAALMALQGAVNPLYRVGSDAMMADLIPAREPLPAIHPAQAAQAASERFGGYGKVLSDKPYRSFVFAFLFTQFSASILWVMLSVYSKTNFGMPESSYGLIPMTNALMVVLFQIPGPQGAPRRQPSRRRSEKASPCPVLPGDVALGSGF